MIGGVSRAGRGGSRERERETASDCWGFLAARGRKLDQCNVRALFWRPFLFPVRIVIPSVIPVSRRRGGWT